MNLRLPFSEKTCVRVLFLTAGILGALHLANLLLGGDAWQFERLFHLGLENNIPTWFSSILLVLTAIVAYSCVKVAQSKTEKLIWLCFAFVFLVLSCDEVAMLHENIGPILAASFYGNEFVAKFKATSWPLVLGPMAILLAGFFLFKIKGFLRRSRTANLYLVVGFFCLFGGAVGLELTENILTEDRFASARPFGTLTEELLEMCGTIFILTGLFQHKVSLSDGDREV